MLLSLRSLLLLRATIPLLLVASLLLPTPTAGRSDRGGVLQDLYEVPAGSSIRNHPDNGYTRLQFGGVALLDEDFRDIDFRLSSKLSEYPATNFALALRVFEEGTHSEPYAILTISDPEFVRLAVPPGTRVRGTSESGATIHGICHEGSGAGNVTLVVHYSLGGTDDHADIDPITGLLKSAKHDGEKCRVGGNPAPITDGCFRASGSVEIELELVTVVVETTIAPNTTNNNNNNNNNSNSNDNNADVDLLYFDYTYDPFESNSNALSLATLRGDRTDPYRSTLQKFIDFYGTPDYDTEWILAAFEGRMTPGFTFDFNGNNVSSDMDFGELNFEGRYAAVRWGTVAIKLWIFVVESLEEAVAVCGAASSSPHPPRVYEDALGRWDRAVAAHTGSEPILEPNAGLEPNKGDGYFLYNLIQEECKEFGTCTSSDPMAPLNRDILQTFRNGREALRVGNCFGAGSHARKLASKLTIPLVQGVFRNAYELDIRENFSGLVQGQIAAYSAGIVPLMFECSYGVAYQMFDGIVPGRAKSGASFEVIRDTLEDMYTCLGVTCEDIGGLVDHDNEGYLPAASPCGVQQLQENQQDAEAPWETAAERKKLNNKETLVVTVSIVSGVVVGILLALFLRYGRRFQDAWQAWSWKRNKNLTKQQQQALQKEKERQRQRQRQSQSQFHSGSSKHGSSHGRDHSHSGRGRRGSSTRRTELSERDSSDRRATMGTNPLDDLESNDDDFSFGDVSSAVE